MEEQCQPCYASLTLLSWSDSSTFQFLLPTAPI